MQGVGVVGAIAEQQPIAPALLQHELAIMRIGLAVDREQVEGRAPPGIFSNTISMVWSGALGWWPVPPNTV